MVEVWGYYVNGKPLSVANTKGNYRLKSSQVPLISLVSTIVQHFFMERQNIRQREVAKYVMDFLDVYGFITVDRENNKDVKYALRLVQRYLY